MMSERRSVLRMALLAAVTAVVLAAAMIAPLGQAAQAANPGASQATSAPSKDTNNRGKIEKQGMFYNTKVRCPGKNGAVVWDGNGKGNYGPGFYHCFRGFKWDPLTWWLERPSGGCPWIAPSTERDNATEPRKVSARC